MPKPGGRLRAYAAFLFAIAYFFVARIVARAVTQGVSFNQGQALMEQVVLALLLFAGFTAMGFVFDRQMNPIAAPGFPLRSGWVGESGLGIAIGWGLTVACVLPLTIAGGIAIRISGGSQAWRWFVLDAAFFAVAALVEEMAFRGYAFQRFAGALGGFGAALAFASFYGILQTQLPTAGSSVSILSIGVSVALSLVLATAYLRTRALWLSWGINFAWKASRALLFGLALSGDTSHSPIVQGDPMGRFWLTGGGFGLDRTWLTCLILLAGIVVVYRLTSDLDYKYNAPEIVAAGVPVDLDAAARRQHETAMGPQEPAVPALVQILPVATSAAAAPSTVPSWEPQPDSAPGQNQVS